MKLLRVILAALALGTAAAACGSNSVTGPDQPSGAEVLRRERQMGSGQG